MQELRVLLVEDDEGLRYAMRVALERAHIAVDEAIDGKDAVQFLVAVKEALEDPARLLLNL